VTTLQGNPTERVCDTSVASGGTFARRFSSRVVGGPSASKLGRTRTYPGRCRNMVGMSRENGGNTMYSAHPSAEDWLKG